MDNGDAFDHEWKREVHNYIDEQIEKHNTANQLGFQALRDGQRILEADIKKVLEASANAHKEIITRLERLESKLG